MHLSENVALVSDLSPGGVDSERQFCQGRVSPHGSGALYLYWDLS